MRVERKAKERTDHFVVRKLAGINLNKDPRRRGGLSRCLCGAHVECWRARAARVRPGFILDRFCSHVDNEPEINA